MTAADVLEGKIGFGLPLPLRRLVDGLAEERFDLRGAARGYGRRMLNLSNVNALSPSQYLPLIYADDGSTVGVYQSEESGSHFIASWDVSDRSLRGVTADIDAFADQPQQYFVGSYDEIAKYDPASETVWAHLMPARSACRVDGEDAVLRSWWWMTHELIWATGSTLGGIIERYTANSDPVAVTVRAAFPTKYSFAVAENWHMLAEELIRLKQLELAQRCYENLRAMAVSPVEAAYQIAIPKGAETPAGRRAGLRGNSTIDYADLVAYAESLVRTQLELASRMQDKVRIGLLMSMLRSK